MARLQRQVEQSLPGTLRAELAGLGAGMLHRRWKCENAEEGNENRPGSAHGGKIEPGPQPANRGDAVRRPASCAPMRIPLVLSLALLSVLASAAACSEELAPPESDRQTIDAGTFTAALSDLVVARIELLPDTAAYERRSEEILRGHGVSEDGLRTFVQVHGQNDDVMTRTYATVGARLDSLYPTGQPAAGADTLIGALADSLAGR